MAGEEWEPKRGSGTTIVGATISGKITKAQWTGIKRDALEWTNLDSLAAEFIPGLPDYGTLKLDVLLDVGSLISDSDDELQSVTFTAPNGTSKTMDCVVTSKDGSFEAKTLMTGTIELKISGKPADATPAPG